MDHSIRPLTIKEQAKFEAIEEHARLAASQGLGYVPCQYAIGTVERQIWCDEYERYESALEEV